ncbi:AI-2E family transporter [Halobacteriales archaeon Cl-PHB]
MEARTAFAWLLVGVLTLVTWLLVQPFLGWLLATGLLAFVLAPVDRLLAPRVGPRLSAGSLTVLVVALVFVPIAVGLNALFSRGPALLEGVSRAGAVERIQRTIREATGRTVPVDSYLQGAADALTSYAGSQAPTLLSQSLHAVLGLLLLTFVLYYLLKDGNLLMAWLHRVIPLEPSVRQELFDAVDAMIWAVLKGHVLVAGVQGLVAGVSLFLTGVPNPWLLTVAMMVLALVPIVGVAPVLGGAILYLFLQGQTLGAAFVFLWGMTTVAITDDYLRAVLIDRESDMHSAFIFLGILGGTYLLGAIGLFVGPILVGFAKTTVEVLGVSYGVVEPPAGDDSVGEPGTEQQG